MLSAFDYWPNDVVVHTDESFMPKQQAGVGLVELVLGDRGHRQGDAHAHLPLNTLQELPAGHRRSWRHSTATTIPPPGTLLAELRLRSPDVLARRDRRAAAAAEHPGCRPRLVRGRVDALRLPRGRHALRRARRRGAGRHGAVGRRARREPHARDAGRARADARSDAHAPPGEQGEIAARAAPPRLRVELEPEA